MFCPGTLCGGQKVIVICPIGYIVPRGDVAAAVVLDFAVRKFCSFPP